MSDQKVAYQLHVTGDVQGVFFRASAKEEAEKLELTGFARNEPDESVMIEIEGTAENADSFIEWCKNGPKHAEVSKVEVKKVKPQLYANFSVL